MTALFAWTKPLSFTSRLDHTWVTSCDMRGGQFPDLESVKASGEFYWFCWGNYHPSGGTAEFPDGLLIQTDADYDLAQCLVRPNISSVDDDDARGTIFQYGIHGVCHQLANQVLYAARVAGPKPLVADAKGYRFSAGAYFDYGRTIDAWALKKAGCGGTDMDGEDALDGGPDDLVSRIARTVLADDPSLIAEFEAIRAQHAAEDLVAFGSSEPGAEELNARNRELFLKLQQAIGEDRFFAIFGDSAEEAPDLVDPAILDASRMRPTGNMA